MTVIERTSDLPTAVETPLPLEIKIQLENEFDWMTVTPALSKLSI